MRIKSAVDETDRHSLAGKPCSCIQSQGSWQNNKIISTFYREIRPYFRKDPLLHHYFGMIIIHAAAACTIMPGPCGVMLPDLLQHYFFIIDMITVNQFVNLVAAKRANNIFMLIHSLQRTKGLPAGTVIQMTKGLIIRRFLATCLPKSRC